MRYKKGKLIFNNAYNNDFTEKISTKEDNFTRSVSVSGKEKNSTVVA
jgi:hypothetical protein